MNITRDEFNAYERVRRLGVVNMFDVKKVGQLSGLTRSKIIGVMKDYGKLRDRFDAELRAAATAEHGEVIGMNDHLICACGTEAHKDDMTQISSTEWQCYECAKETQ